MNELVTKEQVNAGFLRGLQVGWYAFAGRKFSPKLSAFPCCMGVVAWINPDKNAPVLLTTNFALTYFAVAAELESLPFGSYLVVTPSDGMSVLTAWSADKFTAELVARSVENFGLAQKVNTRKIIIPGLLSHMQDELQEAMPQWEIVTGTIEACQIPEFLKQG